MSGADYPPDIVYFIDNSFLRKKGGGTIFSWGFLICTTATTASLTAVKYIHKTYRLLTFSKLKLFEIGSVGGATYKLDKS